MLLLRKIFSNFVLSFPLGFWYKEEDEDGAEEGDAGEDEIAWRRPDGIPDDGNQEGDQEGNQPVEGCAEGGGDGPGFRWDEFHIQYPRNGTKTHRECRDEDHQGDEG